MSNQQIQKIKRILVGYEMVGKKKTVNGTKVPNCVTKEQVNKNKRINRILWIA
jgi:hypothetical protein